MGFFNSARKNVADIRDFLKEASGNSLKYSMEANATHMIYIPYTSGVRVEGGNEVPYKSIVAIQQYVHTWGVPYKQIACLQDVVVKDEVTGELVNDGTCPFCDNVGKAWDIFRYRKEIEEASCQLQGEAREKHMKQVNATLGNEMKARERQLMLYVLIVLFKTSNKQPVINQDTGLPDYELKVMKMSESFASKLTKQLETSGVPIEGASIALQYDDSKDAALLAQGRVISVIFPNNAYVAQYPGLIDRINKEVSEFTFDGIDSVFTELKGTTTAKATEMMNESFTLWDNYLEEKKQNPKAKYLEYTTGKTNQPSLDVSQQMPQIPTAGQPQAGGVNVHMPNVPTVPTMPGAGVTAGVQHQTAGQPQVGGMGAFAGAGAGPMTGQPVAGQPVMGQPVASNPTAQSEQNKVNQMFNGAGLQ